MQGWVHLHRSFMDHWLYGKKPFCDAMAWVDLILLANHESNKFYVDGDVVNIERGQTFTSYRSLSNRWGWGAPRIKKFLELLEREKMLEVKTFKNGTLLTLVNYEVYQDTRNANVTQTERNRNVTVTQTERNRNVTVTKQECKNEKNDKNEKNLTSECTPRTTKKKYGAYSRVALTDDEYNRLCVDYGQERTEKAIDFLDGYIEEKGYKSKSHNLALRRWVFDAVKERDSKNRNKTPQQDTFSKWGLTQEDFNT